MTSSILLPRRDLGLMSPSAHFTASTTLLFPQPLGPTTAVMPSPNWKTVRSQKDLNPAISRRRIFMERTFFRRRRGRKRRRGRGSANGIGSARSGRRKSADPLLVAASAFPIGRAVRDQSAARLGRLPLRRRATGALRPVHRAPRPGVEHVL